MFFEKELGMENTIDVWYVTLQRQLKKRKSFNTIEDLTKWCKLNKNKVKITSGSVQVFNIINNLKGKEVKNTATEDYAWIR